MIGSGTGRRLAALLVAAVLGAGLVAGPARAESPDPAMLAGPERLALFLEQGDPAILKDVFSAGDVTILENFPPHVFRGQGDLRRWRALMLAHLEGTEKLRHDFGPAQDFVRTGDTVYFCLPTVWTGVEDGKSFTEHGGWTFVLVREGQAWRIKAYGWAVVSATD